MLFNIEFFMKVTCRSKRDIERKIAPVNKIIKAFRGEKRIHAYSYEETQQIFNYWGEQPPTKFNRQILEEYPNLFRIKEK